MKLVVIAEDVCLYHSSTVAMAWDNPML